MLHAIIFKVKSHSSLDTTVTDYMCKESEFEIEDCMSQDRQVQRRDRGLSERDRRQQRHERIQFKGDAVWDKEGRSCPSIGWSYIWKGTYSRLYRDIIPEEVREWGFVMWDSTRLWDVAADELLMKQWRQFYDCSDPRQSLFGRQR